jgi:hypothetical protein
MCGLTFSNSGYCAFELLSTVQDLGNRADYHMLARVRANGLQLRSELLSRRASLRRRRAFLQLYVPHIQEWNEWFANLVAELQDFGFATGYFRIIDAAVITGSVVDLRLL